MNEIGASSVDLFMVASIPPARVSPPRDGTENPDGGSSRPGGLSGRMRREVGLRLPMRQRARRVFERVFDVFPWRPLAWLVGGASYLAITFLAYEQLDLVFLVLGYGAVGLVALATTFTLLGAALVKWELRKKVEDARRIEMETERPQPTGFVLRDYRWLPLVRVRWTVSEDSKPGQSLKTAISRRLGRAHESVVALERGEFGPLRRRVLIEDVFGFCRVGIHEHDELGLGVLPHIGALGRLPVLTTFAGGDDWPHPMGVAEGDRVELRRYAPGDPARFIHWKVFSRTRKLMVRMPERALTRARRTLAYLVAGADDDATAAAARVAVENRAFGDEWVFSADGSAATSHIAEATAAIVQSAGHRQMQGSGLDAFVNEAEKSGPAAVVIFAPARPGPWVDRVLAVARARPGRCRIVIAVDGLRAAEERGWAWWLVAPKASRAASVVELDQVLASLAAARAETLVLDRLSGGVLSEAHRAAVRRRTKSAPPKPDASRKAA